MQIIQEQLRKVGIKIELEVLEHATWHAQIRKNLSPMVLYGAARFPVADSYLTRVLPLQKHCRALQRP